LEPDKEVKELFKKRLVVDEKGTDLEGLLELLKWVGE
jgi:hypothetical protein